MVTKFLDFIHKHPKYKVVKSFFYYLDRFSRNSAKTEPRSWFFGIENHKIDFFFNFFISKSPNFISNLNEDCSQLSFEVYNVCVAQNLRISEFLIEFFFAWTLATSATSRGRNFNLSNLNRVSNFSSRPKLSYETLFVAQKWNWEELDYVFSIRAESAPPRVSRRPKSPGLLGLMIRRLEFQWQLHIFVFIEYK